MKKATQELRPVNETPIHEAKVYSSHQVEPMLKTIDRMDATGTRVLAVYGCPMPIGTSSSDEGVWLEDDLGGKITAENAVVIDATLSKLTFTAPLTHGSYWVVIQARDRQTGQFLRARHRLTVI